MKGAGDLTDSASGAFLVVHFKTRHIATSLCYLSGVVFSLFPSIWSIRFGQPTVIPNHFFCFFVHEHDGILRAPTSPKPNDQQISSDSPSSVGPPTRLCQYFCRFKNNKVPTDTTHSLREPCPFVPFTFCKNMRQVVASLSKPLFPCNT